eukprot:CAMPEP_0184241484 /NCGR_PEP_ID=MMETSP0976-20121227/28424_1 /TAXON_ID=483370 /ORGANISM="non described non described, Strain CCMP2097" /LENGTH=377 /DNA_ID=CAMNT_0026546731 /DNA_START=113 /DNA_END=1243 /DNA_ORIENTATION=-
MARLRSSGHEPVAAAQAGHPSDGQGSSRRWRIACAAVGLFGVGSVGVVYYPGARAGLDARSEPTVRGCRRGAAREPRAVRGAGATDGEDDHEAAGHGARAPAARASAPQAHAEDGDGAESDSEEETLLALQCKSTALTRDAMTMKRKQHRPVILRLQPGGAQRKVCDAATGPSYTLTPRGWEDAFGECLAAMTGFRVIAHNADGTCSRCDTFEAVDCEYAEPAAVLVIGSSAKASFECAGQRCGEVHEPLTVDGVVDTFAADYTGACFADDVDANGASVFRGDASAVPRTRFFWIPEAEAEDRRRALWERSALFAAEPPARRAIWDKVTRAVDASLPGDAAPSAVDDYTFLKSIILPIFQRAPLAAAVTVIQGDAFP